MVLVLAIEIFPLQYSERRWVCPLYYVIFVIDTLGINCIEFI